MYSKVVEMPTLARTLLQTPRIVLVGVEVIIAVIYVIITVLHALVTVVTVTVTVTPVHKGLGLQIIVLCVVWRII